MRIPERFRAAPLGPWLIFGTVAVSTFMATLDASIVNVALPTIEEQFGSGLSLAQWVVTAYFLAISSLLPLFGRAGDMYSRKTLYFFGFLIFTVGSALCGASNSMGALIAARVVQAVGASINMANGPAFIVSHFPARGRGRALGMVGTAVALGSMTGPSLGGLLLGWLGWRSIFYVNLPVGLLGCVMAYLLLPPEDRRPAEPLDIAGAVLFACGMTALLLLLGQGREWGWGSPAALSCAAVAVLGLAAFLLWEARSTHPMLDLRLFRIRVFLSGNVAGLLSFMAGFSNVILLPFYLSDLRGLPPVGIGLLLTPLPLVMGVAAPISGYLSERVNQAALACAGLSVMALGLAHQATLSAGTPLWRVALGQAILGLGNGLFQSPNNNSILSAAPSGQAGVASSIIALVRNVGMASGVALAVTIFEIVRHLEAPAVGAPAGFVAAYRAALLAGAAMAAAGALVSAGRRHGLRPRPAGRA